MLSLARFFIAMISFELEIFGEVAEWPIAAVLKTVDPKGSVSSNLTLSVIFQS